MAGTAVSKKGEFYGGGLSEVDSLRLSHNALVDDVELLRAAIVAMATKLDADAGVTDTNYAAGATVAAINPATDLTGYKVNLL
jgi:hypothetical protein